MTGRTRLPRPCSTAPFRSRHDRTDEFIQLKDYVLKRFSGGAELYQWYIRTVESKLFVEAEGDDADDAWTWATIVAATADVFDDTTGEEQPRPMATVKYIGGGTWQAYRETYELAP